MSRQGFGSPTGTQLEKGEFKKLSRSSHGDSGANRRSQKSGVSPLSHPGVPLISDPALFSREDGIERSVSLEPGSVLEKALESLERNRENDRSEKTKDRIVKDSTKVAKQPRRLETKQSGSNACGGRDTEIQRYMGKRSSKNDPRRSKSNALVAKPKSKLMIINEKIGQPSIHSHATSSYRRMNEGRVFGLLFFTGKTGKTPAAVKEEGKKDKKEKRNDKDTKRTKTKNVQKDDHNKSRKKPDGKRTRRHSQPKKSMKSSGDRQGRADKSRAKKSESQGRKHGTSATSKSMKTLCKVEISADKTVSGLVLKVCEKRS